MGLTASFNASTQEGYIPLQDRNRIRSPYGADIINFNYILKTGDAGEFNIELAADDAYTRTIGQVHEKVFKKIENSQKLQDLLEKSSWNQSDREKWEKTVSKMISDEFLKIPGLKNYRADYKSGNNEYSYKLNDLAHDITDPKDIDYAYVCSHMNITEGLILQKIENNFLSREAAGFKRAASYFCAGGGVLDLNETKIEKESGIPQRGMPHMYILSSATGNIIEATSDGGNHYKKPVEPYSLEKYIIGAPFYAQDGVWIYDPYSGRTREGIEANGFLAKSKAELLEEGKQTDWNGKPAISTVSFSKNENFALVTRSERESKKSFQDVYVLVNEGTDEEQYWRTSHEEGNITYVNSFADNSLTGKDGHYRYDREFDESGVPTGKITTYIYDDADKPEKDPGFFNVDKLKAGASEIIADINSHITYPDKISDIVDPFGFLPFVKGLFEDNVSASDEKDFKESAAPPKRDPIKEIQSHLGLKDDGNWGPKTSQAFANLMAEVQVSLAYKNQLPKGGDHPDFFYGPKTEKAMAALHYEPGLIQAISALYKNGQLQELYQGPESVKQAFDHAGSQKTTSVQLGTDREMELAKNPFLNYPGLSGIKM
ncbi:MAG: hypothetical protein K9G62_06340 [Alphaproteobacteria bacterium]|nr:hypothetical protein [Alphaproteobacteria bacterium]